MDLIERIEELQVLIEEAKAVPLSSSAVINREEFLELLAQLKQEVPEEIRQARWMSRDRDELLGRARKEAERITDDAKERSAKMRLEAEDYIDQKLAGFEILLNKTIATVERGRAQLQGEKHSSVQMPTIDAGEPPPTAASGPFDAAELQEPAV